MYVISCEICHTRTKRENGQKRIFMAKFPLDPDRCKKWIAATGNEDLIYFPIEKLHKLKYICGSHFRPRDFKKKKTQLRKYAVPSINITSTPLPDHMFEGFPFHIGSDQNCTIDHNYCNYPETRDKILMPSTTAQKDMDMSSDDEYADVQETHDADELYEPSSGDLDQIEITLPNAEILKEFEIVGIKILLRRLPR